MKLGKLTWLTWLVILITWLLVAWYYTRLPESVPVHWNYQGVADRYMDKPWGALLLPIITTGLVALLMVLPTISPKGFRLEAARRSYGVIIFVMALFMLAIQIVTFEVALGRGWDISKLVPAGVGLLLAVIGNYLSKFPKNFFVGIRTPWTLASDEVWFKTHRLAGWLFSIAGVVMFFGALIGLPMAPLIVVVLAAALIPVVFSLFYYRKLHGFKSENNS